MRAVDLRARATPEREPDLAAAEHGHRIDVPVPQRIGGWLPRLPLAPTIHARTPFVAQCSGKLTSHRHGARDSTTPDSPPELFLGNTTVSRAPPQHVDQWRARVVEYPRPFIRSQPSFVPHTAHRHRVVRSARPASLCADHSCRGREPCDQIPPSHGLPPTDHPLAPAAVNNAARPPAARELAH
jgi:hypothetical protein